jgi:trehalose 6-phosphate synthase
VEAFFNVRRMGPLRNIIRLTLPLIIGVAIVAAVASVVTTRTTRAWFDAELATRARLAGSSAQIALMEARASGNPARAARVLNNMVRDERVIGAALCDSVSRAVALTPSYPRSILGCDSDSVRVASTLRSGQSARRHVFTIGADMQPVHVTVTPLEFDDAAGHRLVIVQDFEFVEDRMRMIRTGVLVVLGTLAMAAALLTILSVRLTSLNWTRSLRRALRGEHEAGRSVPLLDDVRALVQRLGLEGTEEHEADTRWTPQRLRAAVEEQLGDEGLVVVANREPYIHEYLPDGSVEVVHPASGLVSALEPVMRACAGVWIAHGSGSADRETVDQRSRLWVPPDEKSYRLRRVWMNEAEEQGYYYGLANEGLWPLCHLAYARPIFRAADWEHYRRINQRFADAVIEEVSSDDPIVLVQDYHFALAPRMIRQNLPRATVITFWHIPWPNAERFGIFPWREELIDGLLGSSIVGFHTQAHCNQFMEAVDTFIESRLDRVDNAIVAGGDRSLVRPYPISVEWPVHWIDDLPAAEDCRRQVMSELHLANDAIIALGVDRLDYTKGIEERFEAVEQLLERCVDLRGRFTFVQLAAPSRTRIPQYQQLTETVEQSAQRINERFGTDSYQPVILWREHHEPSRVYRFYRAADLCYVSSLHDGMNLVAKEFVAARDDERGVLVLSRFAGAARELSEALIVNPYDLEEASQALERAVRMPPSEQGDRMRAMRAVVSQNNVYRWAGRMLLDAASLRDRARRTAHLDKAAFSGVA